MGDGWHAGCRCQGTRQPRGSSLLVSDREEGHLEPRPELPGPHGALWWRPPGHSVAVRGLAFIISQHGPGVSLIPQAHGSAQARGWTHSLGAP